MPFKWKEGANPRKKIDPDKMKNAIETLIETGRSVRSVAEEFGIDRKTLGRYRDKIEKGIETTFTPNYNTSQIFSDEEEEDLKNYLIFSAKLNYGLGSKEMRKFAYEYAMSRGKKIPENWEKNKSASYDWQMGFMSRQTELSLRNPQATSLARGTAFNETTVSEFFSNLRSVYVEHKFDPDSVYNIDETGLTTVHRPGKIIAAKGQKQVSKVTSAERGTLITICCAVSAVGNAVTPFFVYPQKRVNNQMTQGAPPGSCAVGVESGWMTTDSFNAYLDHFIKNVKCSHTNPVLVVLDNHESHISPIGLQKCKDNGITLVSLPPHTSHKLQPLDRSVFGPFKAAYNRAAEDFMTTNPGKTIDIYTIPNLVGTAFPRAFTPTNISSGFRCTGIWPFDSNIFDSSEFLSSSVTDRPNPVLSQPSTSSNTRQSSPAPSALASRQSPEISASSTVLCIPKCAGISPQDVRPFPKAQERKKNHNRQRVKSRILTSTPVKESITNEYEERRKKRIATKNLFSKKLVKKQKKIETVAVQQIQEPVEEVPVALQQNFNFETWGDSQFNCEDFVMVRFVTKTTLIHYIGKVLEVNQDEDECKISFMRRYRANSDYFVFPNVEDVSFVQMQDLIKLPNPLTVKGSERISSKIYFNLDFSKMNLR